MFVILTSHYFPLCYVLVATCTEKGMALLWHIANYCTYVPTNLHVVCVRAYV